jgi:hypothetical protein
MSSYTTNAVPLVSCLSPLQKNKNSTLLYVDNNISK